VASEIAKGFHESFIQYGSKTGKPGVRERRAVNAPTANTERAAWAPVAHATQGTSWWKEPGGENRDRKFGDKKPSLQLEAPAPPHPTTAIP
jgi:hypothetical protein